MNHFHRLCAHPSTRACLMVLALFALMAIAEQICRLTGAGEM
jgi:hypothetical protein